MLPYLDGTRDRATLVEALARLIEGKVLVLPERQPGEPLQDLMARLAGPVGETLGRLARMALLVG